AMTTDTYIFQVVSGSRHFLTLQPLARTVADGAALATAGARPTNPSSGDARPTAHTASAADAARCETLGSSNRAASGTAVLASSVDAATAASGPRYSSSPP